MPASDIVRCRNGLLRLKGLLRESLRVVATAGVLFRRMASVSDGNQGRCPSVYGSKSRRYRAGPLSCTTMALDLSKRCRNFGLCLSMPGTNSSMTRPADRTALGEPPSVKRPEQQWLLVVAKPFHRCALKGFARPASGFGIGHRVDRYVSDGL